MYDGLVAYFPSKAVLTYGYQLIHSAGVTPAPDPTPLPPVEDERLPSPTADSVSRMRTLTLSPSVWERADLPASRPAPAPLPAATSEMGGEALGGKASVGEDGGWCICRQSRYHLKKKK